MTAGAQTMDAADTGRFRRLTDSSVDELNRRTPGGLSERERELALGVAEIVAQALPGLIKARPDNGRLADLEHWREATDQWRLKLTGVDDGNGRIGRLDRRIDDLEKELLAKLDAVCAQFTAAAADLRRDVGTPKEREAEKKASATVAGVRRKLVATVSAAVVAVGGGGWAAYKATTAAKEAAAFTAGRIEARLDAHDRALDWLFQGAPRPLPAPRTP